MSTLNAAFGATKGFLAAFSFGRANVIVEKCTGNQVSVDYTRKLRASVTDSSTHEPYITDEEFRTGYLEGALKSEAEFAKKRPSAKICNEKKEFKSQFDDAFLK